jgi:hypothetical protein
MPAFGANIAREVTKIVPAGKAEWETLAFEGRRDFRANNFPQVLKVTQIEADCEKNKRHDERRQSGCPRGILGKKSRENDCDSQRDKCSDKETAKKRQPCESRVTMPRHAAQDFATLNFIEMVKLGKLSDGPEHGSPSFAAATTGRGNVMESAQ